MKGYRTIIANLTMLAPLLVQLAAEVFIDPSFSAIVPPQYQALYGIVVAVANIYLRTKTTTPVGKKL